MIYCLNVLSILLGIDDRIMNKIDKGFVFMKFIV